MHPPLIFAAALVLTGTALLVLRRNSLSVGPRRALLAAACFAVPGLIFLVQGLT